MKFKKDSKLQLVKTLDESLYYWAFNDIQKAAMQGDAKMAGFILGACFIDALSGFYSGLIRKDMKSGSAKRFKNFVKKYLPKYDPELLYGDLRCGLVHSYSAGETYVFTDANKAGKHFEVTSTGKIILNLEDFILDLHNAYNNYRKDILENFDIFKKAEERFHSIGIMQSLAISKL